MKTLVSICRVLVGALFIVSGLIKANDAVGFAYKLEEYFSPDVLGWLTWMEPYAYPMAVLVCIAEIILGLAILLGAKMKLATWATLLLIIFFGFLTFYSAYFNKVTDCGCFGDAIKLTPWGSFSKDMVLLVLIIPIFLWRGKIDLNTDKQDMAIAISSIILVIIFSLVILGDPWVFPIWAIIILWVVSLLVKKLVNSNVEWMMAGAATVLCAAFSYYTYAHLPIKDFRPYAIEKSISKGMKTADELPEDHPYFNKPTKYANVYILKRHDGGADEVLSTEYMDNRLYEDTITYINPYKPETLEGNVLVEKGWEPPVHDFEFYDADGNDKTHDLLSGKKLFVIAYDLSKANIEIQAGLAEMTAGLQRGNVPVIGLTSSNWEDIETFRHDHQLGFAFYQGDGTTLKTIVRSTPGLVAMDNGTIIGKWHYNDMPSTDELIQLLN